MSEENKKTQEEIVKEYNYCIRCGRKLKSVENRIRGMGKICYEKSLRERRNGIRRIFEK